MKELKVLIEKQFNDINIFEFGTDYQINGMVLTGGKGDSLLIVLPEEDDVDTDRLGIVRPTMEEWHLLLNQLDTVGVECIRDNQKIILRKSQRNIDTNVSWEVYRRDGYKCRYCGEEHKPLTVDHIITWEDGGASLPANLLTCCKKCNKVRGNMKYQDWLQTDYYRNSMAKLTVEVIANNSLILAFLDTLPRVPNKRSR